MFDIDVFSIFFGMQHDIPPRIVKNLLTEPWHYINILGNKTLQPPISSDTIAFYNAFEYYNNADEGINELRAVILEEKLVTKND